MPGGLANLIVLLLAVLIVGWIVIRLLSRSYVKTTAATAFVRTGGLRVRRSTQPLVVVNGSAWVFGFLHRIKWVSLETMAINIEHIELNALITNDPQYVDLKALFFIRVSDQPSQISVAARTIGGEVVNEASVVRVVKPKVNGAVRDIAATFSLNQLLEQRIDFTAQVKQRLQSELEDNGLVVESVSILTLRPTLLENITTNDILGAQVARASAAVIEDALTAKNRLERQGALERARQDAEAEREQLGIEEEIEKERAERIKNITVVRSAEEAEAKVTHEQKRQEAERARILADRSLQEELLENERAESLLREQLEQAIAKEKVAREEAVALAEEERQKRVAKATVEKLTAIKKQIEADSEREQALQAAMTVAEKAVAEREAEVEIINTRLQTEKQAMEVQSQTETEALRRRILADSEREVAVTNAEATRTQAQAEREVARLEAEGEQDRKSAEGLAQVQVDLERLKVLLQEAEAVKVKLLAEAEGEKAKAEAMASHDAVGKELALARLEAEVRQAVETAKAEALGQAISGMNMNLIGDATMAQRMLELVSTIQTARQVYDTLPTAAKEIVEGLAERITPSEEGTSSKITLLQATGQLLQHIQSDFPDLIEQNPNLGDLAAMFLEQDDPFAHQHRDLLNALMKDPNLHDLPLETAIALARNWLGDYEDDESKSIWL